MTLFERMRANEAELTFEEVDRLLRYEPEAGEFFWKVDRRGRAGQRAGCLRPDGYRQIRIEGQDCYEQRLAHLLMTGAWPAELMDHKDPSARGDNRWNEIRSASRSENQANRRGIRGYSLPKGVHKANQSKSLAACIQVNGRKIYLGSFRTAEAAHAAYAAAAQQHFGEFARMN